MIKLKNEWQPFWGGYIVDEEKTTATRVIHNPERGESHFVFDAEWENHAISYANVVKCADGIFRLYYIGYPESEIIKDWTCVCCIESSDGINWHRPEYGIFEFNGSKKNNIVWLDLRKGVGIVDNFLVFYDENPNCPEEEKYKALGLEPCVDEKWDQCNDLWCYVSPDGIYWKFGWVAMEKPDPIYWYFDSDNHVVWDGEKYILYYRGRHVLPEKMKGVDESSDEFKQLLNSVYNYRDIRYAYSYDFKHWEIKGRIEYLDREDFQLYANHIIRYPRNENIFVGFPVRNVERRSLQGSLEHLGGAVAVRNRKAISVKSDIRAGAVITDSLFMNSCDGVHWDRDLEAFYKNGAETADNWQYGDGYIVPYLWETEGRHSRIDKEFSFYYTDYHRSPRPQELVMYHLRLDGFRSLKGGYYGAKITTKPFVFEGDKLYLNFSTSAPGNIYITVTDENGNKTESCEIFGDTTERIIDFDKPLSSFAGKTVVMEIRLKEAEVYSFRFGHGC